MKFELPDVTRRKLEEFFIALVEYQLQGRLMIFQGLCSHLEMIGAINILQSIIGYERSLALIKEVTDRPLVGKWTKKDGSPKDWKFKNLNVAYTELVKKDHSCFYCKPK